MEIKILATVLLVTLALALSACSFHVGFDYNGKTGIDNRTQTTLVKSPSVQKEKY